MRTKNLYLCLLFLFFLGTTTVWADKYYMPGSYKSDKNRLTLEEMLVPGTKFMIYDAALNGAQDRTGFLRNKDDAFAHDKSKERDMFVYNENFVYTLEAGPDDNADGTPDYYAIKSLSTGTYVDVLGNTTHSSAASAQLFITSWSDAVKDGSGVALSGASLEGHLYNNIGNGDIATSAGTTTFAVGGKVQENDNEVTKYWNGEEESFAIWSDAHPYVFYIAQEVTSGDYLQDLHIYSRSDIYSAQVIYGYVQLPNKITTVNTPTDGTTANLLDGDITTSITVAAGDSYTFDLGTSSTAIYLYLQQNADASNVATKINVEVPTDKSEWTSVTGNPFATGLNNNYFYASDKIELGGSYQYVRISNNASAPMSFSEAYILPACGEQQVEVEHAIEYINAVNSAESVLYTKATAKKYAQIVAEYNSNFPEARLLSGVPIAGSKYRIYADAYDIDASKYINKEVKAGDTDGAQLGCEASGSYHSAADAATKKAFEWYCEQTPDGKLVFRNVAYPTLYLGNGVVTTERYKWSINTILTHHFGVPLKNEAEQYLAMANEGFWMGNVKETQDQTVYPVSVDHDNNSETEAQVINKGLCTDFVFIPVPIDGEKKITFTANNIVERNTRLLFDADGDGVPEEQPLPFSRMFKETEELPILELLCPSLHDYRGIKLNNETEYTQKEVATRNEVDDEVSVSFNLGNIENNDVLNICFEIYPDPFTLMDETLDLTKEPSLYFIKNMRPWESRQQARPRRAAAANSDIEIGDEEEGPIDLTSKNSYYAKFNTRSSRMSLSSVAPTTDPEEVLEATSLFYFTSGANTNREEYYSVMINNATTIMKCADDVTWNKSGNAWYVQPHKTASYIGYNIGQAALKDNKNDRSVQSWCSNHDNGDEIQLYGDANDDGTAWEFVPVDNADAREILYNFIKDVAAELNTILDEREGEATAKGYDTEKIEDYRYIIDEFLTRAEKFHNGTYTSEQELAGLDPTAKLLQFARNIHMVEHEIEYALLALPEPTDETKMGEDAGFEHPHWYYVKNVISQNYAAYTGDETAMTLADEEKTLSNLFYFSGTRNTFIRRNPAYEAYDENNFIVDDYLKGHIHNFEAVQKTLVSQNTVKVNITPTINNQGTGFSEILPTGTSLSPDDNWCIELVYELDGLEQYNAYGSCLVSSLEDPTADNYADNFQVFFKDNFDVVVKLNNNSNQYRFEHTQEAFTTIKVVITQAQGRTTIDVYNSKGDKKSVSAVIGENDYYPTAITTLKAAIPAKGVTVKNLKISDVESMTWMEHVADAEKDLWYILPSSNTTNPGLAIVMLEPDDTQQGWTKTTINTVDNDLGTQDASTWLFEKVVDFDAHIDELLARYGLDNCVIYDKELAKLMRLIAEKEAIITAQDDGGDVEEAAFNAVYDAIINYTGKMPAELLAPKRGALYTIRPLADEGTDNALLAHIAAATNDGYSTKELYNGPAIRDDQSIDTRAVWMFDGTDGTGGFLSLTGLSVKNLHTQLSLPTLGSAQTLLDATAASVTLDPKGDCTTYFKVGNKYMLGNCVRYTSYYQAAYQYLGKFWGDAIDTYPAELSTSITTWGAANATVHCKSLPVVVSEEGDVVVKFVHTDGNHRLNMLGVTLVKDDAVAYSDYHFGYKGGAESNNVYTLQGVEAGTYTLNCYVGSGGGDNANYSGGYYSIDGASIEGSTKVTNGGTEATRWIIEEIKNPETTVYHPIDVATHGHSTLMLGFDAKIPTGIQAFWPRQHGPIGSTHYMSMTSYDEGIIPANTPVMLKMEGMSSDPNGFVPNAQKTPFKFYYSSTPATEETPEKLDGVFFGALYSTIVRCADYREGDGSDPNNRIYMLQMSKDYPRLYRIWENGDAAGKKMGSKTDDGGYIVCSPNKAYWVLPYDYTPTQNVAFSLRYDTWGATTDIEEIEEVVENSEAAETIFDLQGRKLDKVTAPGIYIVNGKKVMVK